jgi:predicted DCC family thiol-disulfide oxidoreductase YuxK
VPNCAAPTNAPSAPEAEQPVIFFDGICGLCNRTVDFVIARDHSRLFRFAPLQGETAQRLLNITPDQPLNSMVLIDSDGIHHRTDAVWRMLVGLGGIWRFAGRLLRLVPRPLRNAMYNLLAQNRYRWFGRKVSCRLPAPDERALFLP